MSIPGKLEIERASRRELDRPATLRDSDLQPHDILIEDLSATGCRILINLDVPIGTAVRIGISGVGPRAARIVRGSEPTFGCVFDEPMSDGEIRRAIRADTVIASGFPPQPAQASKGEAPGSAEAAARPGIAAKPKRRIPIWVDMIALALILLFAIHVWRLMHRSADGMLPDHANAGAVASPG